MESAKDASVSYPPIQEALLHYGVWAPQSTIHRAGNSKHPDLYSDEIPTALATLGVQSTKYVAKTKGFAAYEQWGTRRSIAASRCSRA